MNNRTWPVVAVLMLTILSSGCSRTRTFMFGRGARCGALNPASAPAYGNPTPGPCAQARTYQPAPYQVAPCSPPPRPMECGCGYEQNARVYSGRPCPSCGNGYGEVVVSDPYLSGGITPYEGRIIGGEVISDGITPIQSDNFQARPLDSDGNPIIWEAPLPPGSRPL
jgi:hypothetical protein